MQPPVEFQGAVECRVAAGAVGLSLSGARVGAPPRAAVPVRVFFSAVASIRPPLPERLHDARVVERAREVTSAEAAGGAAEPRRFDIEAREGRFEVRSRALQLHQEVGGAFFAAVPQRRAPLPVRWGWSLLLVLLRAPAVARLLTRRR